MVGDKDFASPELIGLDSRPKDIQDKVDFAMEIIGENVGRIARFLPDGNTGLYGEDNKKKEERRFLSRLQQLLLNDAYKAAYQEAMRSLYETQHVVYEALKQSAQELAIADALHKDILDRASTLDDGTRVFLDDDGSAYTEDGRKLTEDEFVQVEWKDNSPSWTEFTDSTDTVEKARGHNEQIQRHSDRLEEIEQEIKDAEHPPSKDRLIELNSEIKDIQNNIDMSGQDAVLQRTDIKTVVAPELSF